MGMGARTKMEVTTLSVSLGLVPLAIMLARNSKLNDMSGCWGDALVSLFRAVATCVLCLLGHRITVNRKELIFDICFLVFTVLSVAVKLGARMCGNSPYGIFMDTLSLYIDVLQAASFVKIASRINIWFGGDEFMSARPEVVSDKVSPRMGAAYTAHAPEPKMAIKTNPVRMAKQGGVLAYHTHSGPMNTGISVNKSGDTVAPAHSHMPWGTSYYRTDATPTELTENKWTVADDGILRDINGAMVPRVNDGFQDHSHAFAVQGGGAITSSSAHIDAEGYSGQRQHVDMMQGAPHHENEHADGHAHSHREIPMPERSDQYIPSM